MDTGTLGKHRDSATSHFIITFHHHPISLRFSSKEGYTWQARLGLALMSWSWERSVKQFPTWCIMFLCKPFYPKRTQELMLFFGAMQFTFSLWALVAGKFYTISKHERPMWISLSPLRASSVNICWQSIYPQKDS